MACLGPRQLQNEYNNLSELKIHSIVDSDTVEIGDSICVKICYTNITEEPINFIPNSIVLLSHSDPLANYDYGKISSIYLNNKIDEKIIKTIPVHSDYCVKYKIEINDSLFDIGSNEMAVQYIYKPLDSKETENAEKVFNGSIFSNEIVLFIK